MQRYRSSLIQRLARKVAERVLGFAFFLVLPLAILAFLGGAFLARWEGKDSLAASVSMWGFLSGLAALLISFVTSKVSSLVESSMRKASQQLYSATDKDEPVDILYLRPFDVDQRPAGPDNSFEEVLLKSVSGRVVTVADPKPTAKGLGGLRRLKLPGAASVSSDPWQSYVERLIDNSRLIVVVFDWRSDGLRQEVEMICKRHALAKTVLVTYVTDHLGWAAMFASLDVDRLTDCWRATPLTADGLSRLRECLKQQTLMVDVLHDQMPSIDWSARSAEVANGGVDPASGAWHPRIETLRASVDKAVTIARDPAWNTGRLVPSALLLMVCGIPLDYLAMIHQLIVTGVQGVTFRDGARLWMCEEIAKARAREENQSLLQSLWWLVKNLSLMGGNREQLAETQVLAQLVLKMLDHVGDTGRRINSEAEAAPGGS